MGTQNCQVSVVAGWAITISKTGFFGSMESTQPQESQGCSLVGKGIWYCTAMCVCSHSGLSMLPFHTLDDHTRPYSFDTGWQTAFEFTRLKGQPWSLLASEASSKCLSHEGTAGIPECTGLPPTQSLQMLDSAWPRLGFLMPDSVWVLIEETTCCLARWLSSGKWFIITVQEYEKDLFPEPKEKGSFSKALWFENKSFSQAYILNC